MSDKLNIVAIIQARMGSTRLPGKVLMDIEGSPMLTHVVSRVKASTEVNAVIVATSNDQKDDGLYKYCVENGITCYRGSETDVLDRYYKAAMSQNADAIVRITSDCPLIDPSIIDKAVKAYRYHRASSCGASNVVKRTYPRGLDTEVIAFSVLEDLWKKAYEKRYREHVTLYLYEHPDQFCMRSIENKTDLSGMRWTVDEEADLKLIREIYKRLYRPGQGCFSMESVVELLKNEPGLQDINKEIRQKEIGK